MSSLKFPWSEQQEDHVQAIRKEMRKFKPDVIAVSPSVMQSLIDRMNRIDELLDRDSDTQLWTFDRGVVELTLFGVLVRIASPTEQTRVSMPYLENEERVLVYRGSGEKPAFTFMGVPVYWTKGIGCGKE